MVKKVAQRLRASGYRIKVIREFSDSVFGRYLKKSLERDKFLRRRRTEKTALTQTFAVLADYVYLVENRIVPALRQHDFVLKDRAIDTIVACETPKLLAQYPRRLHACSRWLKTVLGALPFIPEVTIYLDVPLKMRMERVKNRNRSLGEARGKSVSGDDLGVFKARDALYRRLICAHPKRIVCLDNTGRLDHVVEEIVSLILARARRRNA